MENLEISNIAKEISFQSVNKFMMYVMNFSNKLYERDSFYEEDAIYAPSCMDAFDVRMRDHLISKWYSYDGNGTDKLIKLYYNLDDGNKAKLINWIVQNYKG